MNWVVVSGGRVVIDSNSTDNTCRAISLHRENKESQFFFFFFF